MRSWRIAYNKRLKKWICPYSLQELADMILSTRNSKLNLDARAYFVATGDDLKGFPVREAQLSRWDG